MISDALLEMALEAEARRRAQWFRDLIEKHPERTRAIACGMLGDAVALADLCDIDVEAFLEDLRANHEKPKPVFLRPKTGGAS